MPKHSIDKYPPFVIAREGPFYSDDDIEAIIAAIGLTIPLGRRDELVQRLEQVVETWIFETAIQHFPTPVQLKKQFTKIERAAARLLDAIETGPPGPLGRIPGPIRDRLEKAATKKAALLGKSGGALLRDSVEGVVQIKRWAEKQIQIENERGSEQEKRSGVKNPRKSTDRAFRNWIMELAKIYHDILGKKPTVSWNNYQEKYYGPFFNFVRAASGVRDSGEKPAMGIVRRSKSNGALAKAIQRATNNMDF